MKKLFSAAIFFFFITFLTALLRYFITPFFPTIEAFLKEVAQKIISVCSFEIDPKVLIFMLACVSVLGIYMVVSFFAERARINLKFINRATINPAVRYKNAPFTLAKILLSLAFVVLIYGYGKTCLRLASGFTLENANVVFFLAGFALFAVVWLIFSKQLIFFAIFEHELTHMILALCFFHKPKSFYVDENEGGWVQVAGVNFIISLAPYFVLTLCFLLIPIYFFIKPEFYIFYFLLMGVFASYHFFSTIRETKFNVQPDIIFNGKVFSFIVILLGNILGYGYILSFVIGGAPGGTSFLQKGWGETGIFIKALLSQVAAI